ncbi:mucin 5B, oligomeric mucus gel-forming [Schaereria dolodes]|nr:mucin 5B, oligomeric mucus gel-forming [Schaereria dolodes]
MHVEFAHLVTAVTISFSFFGGTEAFWRLLCDLSGVARIDPLISPGSVSAHAHNIYGGDAFGMTSSASDLAGSGCSSCQVVQDKSSYWTPAMYFQFGNGTLAAVPVAQHISYYKYTQLMVNGVLTNPSAFPFGLQMISGDTFQRNFSGLPVPDSPQPWSGNDITQANLERKAVGFNCMNYQCPGGCDEPSLYRHFLPTKDYLTAHCPDGIRMELVFPQCWNGKDLDSVDHKSHVAYASDLLNGGTCPPGFDHVLPQLFYETYTYPQDFYSEDGQFVISNGDPTGYGYHGDFIAAWDSGILEAALDQCGDGDPTGDTTLCPVFDIIDTSSQSTCHFKMPEQLANEDCTADRSTLPGNVQIEAGPGYVQKGAPSAAGPSPAPVIASSPIVPTLSFTSGSSASGTYLGNILFAEATTSTSTPPPTSTSTPSIYTPPPAAPTTTSTSTSIVPAPVPTTTTTLTSAPAQAPALSSATNIQYNTISTSTYTSAGALYEVIVVEEEIYVTVTATATPPSTSAGAGPMAAVVYPSSSVVQEAYERREERREREKRRHLMKLKQHHHHGHGHT